MSSTKNEFKTTQENRDMSSEINLIEIISKFWLNRFLVLKFTCIGIFIGIVVAIILPNQYTVSCTLVPQTSQKTSSSGLGGLAAMAGINLSTLTNNETLSPSVYPIIIYNTDFQSELIHSVYNFKKYKTPISLYEYYIKQYYEKFSLIRFVKKYTVGLIKFNRPSIPTNDLNSQSSVKSLRNLSEREEEVIEYIEKKISININEKKGYVTLSFTIDDPLASAEITQKSYELLQKYITAFKIEKVSNNLKFVERNFEESKINFELKQTELAKFRDANKGISSAVAKTTEEKLISEYNLLLSIYTELAKQKEQAKIALTETIPVFTIISPIVVPNKKSQPSRITILLSITLIGFIIGFLSIFFIPFIIDKFNPNLINSKFIPQIK